MYSYIELLPSHELRQAVKIGTRESRLAVWQATLVQELLQQHGIASELVFIRSEGDTDTVTPLYELGVEGIFTRALDAALLNNRIDIAVHSLKDVPTKLADGIRLAAVLERASCKDVLVYKDDLTTLSYQLGLVNGDWPVAEKKNKNSDVTTCYSQRGTYSTTNRQPASGSPFIIATSSIRRMAQWLHRYPHHGIENLRGNINTRLSKLKRSNWNGAIFAAAGLERINLRPGNSLDLDWMLPAPAQGAITAACRDDDEYSCEICSILNDPRSELCTKIERDFLRALLGGCSTPISALAVVENDRIIFKGNICSPDGKIKIEIEKSMPVKDSNAAGIWAATKLLKNEEARKIIHGTEDAKK